MQSEAQELRRRLEQRASWAGPAIATLPTSVAATAPQISPIHNETAVPLPPTSIQALVSPPIADSNEEILPPTPLITQTQTLEDVTLHAGVIDELFQIFLDDFHQFLPSLDEHIRPNEVFQTSPFLFWAVIGTACRDYQKDPSLFDRLGDRVLDLALMSLRRPHLPTIEGLLLVLTWPIPRSAKTTDVTYAITGSLLHMAIQNGLHIPTSSQDFSRVKINLTEIEIRKRALLWGYCVLTYQRSVSSLCIVLARLTVAELVP